MAATPLMARAAQQEEDVLFQAFGVTPPHVGEAYLDTANHAANATLNALNAQANDNLSVADGGCHEFAREAPAPNDMDTATPHAPRRPRRFHFQDHLAIFKTSRHRPVALQTESVIQFT